MDKIDFVITWVDENDPKWKEEKRRYESMETKKTRTDDANADCRYRDDGLLRYWFRSVEKFAPWFNQIHFVTCGQKPEWLNTAHPKLHCVNHADYIPPQYLPTFSARAILLNLHRLEGLSEHFVCFDDDILLLQPIKSDYFFRNGLPVLDADLSYTNRIGYNNWSRTVFNNYCIVKTSFNVRKSIADNWHKWFNLKELGYKRTRKNLLCYLANHTLPSSTYGHLAQPHLKSTLQEIWDRHPEIMEGVSSHKFRSDDGLNPWLLCTWNQAKGSFYPAHRNRLGQNFSIRPSVINQICDIVKGGVIPQICLNDTQRSTDFDNSTKAIVAACETLLPTKSMFEK